MRSSPPSTNRNSSNSNSQHVKQVSFLSVATVYIVENYKLTLRRPQARAKVWYTAMELYTFRKEAHPDASDANSSTKIMIDRRIPAREAYAMRRQQQKQQQPQQQCTPKKQQQQQQQQRRRLYHQNQHPICLKFLLFFQKLVFF